TVRCGSASMQTRWCRPRSICCRSACRRWWTSLQSYSPIEDHIQSRATPQLDLLPTRQQHPSQTDARADPSSDAGALPAAVGEAADSGSTACRYGNHFGVLAFGAALLDIVLPAVYLLVRFAGFNRCQPRRDSK